VHTLKVQIHDGSMPVDGRLRAHVQRRLDYALSAFGDRVGSVVVRLSRDQPTRAPALDCCEIQVAMRPRTVRVTDIGANPFIAVENASERLIRSVKRALEREQAWGADGHPSPRKTKGRK
jgi:ribosome-associated translation inhibitor RaiA